jgi:hypothetical protein
MTSDKSDPRVGLILQVGILAIVSLLATRAVLQAYFDRIERAEVTRKLGTYPVLADMRAEAKKELTGGPMPIDQAMQTLASKGRMNASPDIVPSASKDVAPLQGWSKMPSYVPPEMTAPPPPPPPPPPVPTTSASAAPSAPPPGGQRPRQP